MGPGPVAVQGSRPRPTGLSRVWTAFKRHHPDWTLPVCVSVFDTDTLNQNEPGNLRLPPKPLGGPQGITHSGRGAAWGRASASPMFRLSHTGVAIRLVAGPKRDRRGVPPILPTVPCGGLRHGQDPVPAFRAVALCPNPCRTSNTTVPSRQPWPPTDRADNNNPARVVAGDRFWSYSKT